MRFNRVCYRMRGGFCEALPSEIFAERGLATDFAEVYFDVPPWSATGIAFSLPPHDHAKLVYCVAGQVLDVAVDLRVGSPTDDLPRSS